jgi:hypothetical protein
VWMLILIIEQSRGEIRWLDKVEAEAARRGPARPRA